MNIDHFQKLKQQNVVTEVLLDGKCKRPSEPSVTASALFEGSFFYKSTSLSTISLVTPLSNGVVLQQNSRKTVAYFYRGDRYPVISAVSGWTNCEQDRIRIQRKQTELISSRLWTDETLRISRAIGFNLRPDSRNGYTSGRFYASHAEKQLMTYAVRKHCFFDNESDPYTGSWEWTCWQDKPLLYEAIILVNTNPCANCKLFREHLRSSVGMTFHFHYLPTVTERAVTKMSSGSIRRPEALYGGRDASRIRSVFFAWTPKFSSMDLLAFYGVGFLFLNLCCLINMLPLNLRWFPSLNELLTWYGLQRFFAGQNLCLNVIGSRLFWNKKRYSSSPLLVCTLFLQIWTINSVNGHFDFEAKILSSSKSSSMLPKIYKQEESNPVYRSFKFPI